ncbi:MAG: gliding motility lipoprotein GldB [Cytophagales bacterium]
MNRFLLLLFFGVVLASCKKDREECVFQPPNPNRVQINFQSLEDSLFTFDDKQQLVDFFSRHVALRDVFFNREGYKNDSAFINQLYQRFRHPSFDTLRMETKRVFGNGDELKREFEDAFTNIRYYYPDFPMPKIQTVITGMESDLFVSDSLIIVGLDFYLGRDAKYKPNMYEYMQRRYHKRFVVPSAMLLYGIENSADDADKSVLADMIAYGKAYYFAKHMMPCVPDSVLIGYTQAEIEGARENQDIIWKRLVDDEVFFNTSRHVKQKYISERPKTIEVSPDCPGRIGMWVGWQIVNKFMERNPNVKLQQLMKIKEGERIFKGSKYKPA